MTWTIMHTPLLIISVIIDVTDRLKGKAKRKEDDRSLRHSGSTAATKVM